MPIPTNTSVEEGVIFDPETGQLVDATNSPNAFRMNSDGMLSGKVTSAEQENALSDPHIGASDEILDEEMYQKFTSTPTSYNPEAGQSNTQEGEHLVFDPETGQLVINANDAHTIERENAPSDPDIGAGDEILPEAGQLNIHEEYLVFDSETGQILIMSNNANTDEALRSKTEKAHNATANDSLQTGSSTRNFKETFMAIKETQESKEFKEESSNMNSFKP